MRCGALARSNFLQPKVAAMTGDDWIKFLGMLAATLGGCVVVAAVVLWLLLNWVGA